MAREAVEEIGGLEWEGVILSARSDLIWPGRTVTASDTE